MILMKTIEEIEREYKNYQLHSTSVTDLANFSVFIEDGIDTTKEELKVIQKEVKINNRSQRLTKLRNHFPYLFQERIVDIYEEDNQILEEVTKLILSQREKYERIHSIVTDKNFVELTKLIDFSCEYYNQHVDYFESRRDALIYSYRGFTYQASKYQNNITVFNEFFDKMVNGYREEKSSVKKKVK